METPPHERLRDAGALGGIDEAEEDEVAQQHAPVPPEAPGEPAPVEGLRAGVEQMRDVGAVVALALHDEGLRPDRLLGRAEPDRLRHHGGGHRVPEPVVVHRAHPVARVEDDVDVVVWGALDLGEPVRERDLRLVAQTLLDEAEGAGHVALADEQVEILHRAADPEIALQRVPAAHQELDAGRVRTRPGAGGDAAGLMPTPGGPARRALRGARAWRSVSPRWADPPAAAPRPRGTAAGRDSGGAAGAAPRCRPAPRPRSPPRAARDARGRGTPRSAGSG